MNKKIALLAICLFLLSGCGSKQVGQVDMDQLAADGNYHYRNESLGFSVTLPKEFQYYQFNKKFASDYTELDILVPTADRSYPQEVAGYATVLVVRVYDSKAWQGIADNSGDKIAFEKIGEKNGKTYAIKLWDKVSSDWAKKWTPKMKDDLIKSIAIQ